MLEELNIQNYALVDTLKIKFQSGLTILSGETGAGKSIIVGALGMLFGGRVDPSFIRTGSDEAKVSGVIEISKNKDALEWLREKGMSDEDGYVIIRRTLRKTGRGALSIQSNPVTKAELTEFTSFLFDMHGQHAHQSLLNKEIHRKVLDNYAGIAHEVEKFAVSFMELSSLKKRLQELRKSERDILLERDILEHAVREIGDAGLLPDEENELVKERAILLQHENLVTLFESFDNSLTAEQHGALLNLRRGTEALTKIAEIMQFADTYRERWENAYFEIEDIFQTIKTMEEEVDYSPERLEACEDRLQHIRRLKNKYGSTIEDVLQYRIEAEKKLANFDTRNRDIADLEIKIDEKEKSVLEKAHFISKHRRDHADLLTKGILANLKNLGMDKASFQIKVTNRETEKGKVSCGSTGKDSVEFLISPNVGEPLKPLKTIASGGELSRIMLSIKSVLANSDNISTLIFDEIDSGIGGEVALSVGEHLVALAKHKQILCITHLASIAVCADNHLKVNKMTEEGRTYTKVESLSGDKRVKEIARMLAGDSRGTASLDHARELLYKYQK